MSVMGGNSIANTVSVTPGGVGSLVQGGTLQMAKVKGVANVNLATTPVDATYELEWVTIANPDADRGDVTGPTGNYNETVRHRGIVAGIDADLRQ